MTWIEGIGRHIAARTGLDPAALTVNEADA
jgi:hypothetical protein